MKKLKNAAGNLDTFFKAMQVCTNILAVASVVGIVLILAAVVFHLDPGVIGTGFTSLDIGFLTLEIAPEFAPAPQTILIQAAVILVFAFALALVCRKFFTVLRQILAPMAQGEPFHAKVSEKVADLAKLSIVIGILANAAILVSQAITVFALDLPTLLVSERINKVTGNFVADLSFLAFSAVLFLLSHVFHHGEELQQLSDETL